MATGNFGNVGGAHGTQGAAPLTAAQQKSAAVKALADQVTGGGWNGLGFTGPVRDHQGRHYVSKPKWTPALLFGKAAAKAAADQKAVFKEQRFDKHRDRLLDELQSPTPNLNTLARSLKFLDKTTLARGMKIRHLYSTVHPSADSTQRIALATTLKTALQDLVANHSAKLGAKTTSFANLLVTRFGDMAAGMPSLDQINHFRATDNGAFMAGLGATRTAAHQAEAQKTTATRTGEIQQFHQQGIGNWTDLAQVNWRVSPGGACGVIMVSDPATANLHGVLKFDNEAKTGAANCIGSVLQHVRGNATTPLPFDAPLSQFIKADPNGTPGEQQLYADLRGLVTAQRDIEGARGTEAGDVAEEKCKGYLKDLADAKGVTRYSAASASDIKSLPIGLRMELFHSDQFAEDLAAAGIVAPFLGFADHVGFVRGNTNIQNLMLGDNGRLAIVDFEGNSRHVHNPDGSRTDSYGFDAQELTTGLSDFLADIDDILQGRTDLDKLVADIRKGNTTNKFALTFVPLLDDHPKIAIFPEKTVAMEMISDREIKDLMLRVASKTADKLTYLKSQAAVIGAAHDNEPTSVLHGSGGATMTQIVGIIDAFDQGTAGGGLAAIRNLAPAPRPPYMPPLPPTPPPTVPTGAATAAQGIVLPPIDDGSESG